MSQEWDETADGEPQIEDRERRSHRRRLKRRGQGRLARTWTFIRDRFAYNERGTGLRLTRRIGLAIVLAIPLYYLIGIFWVHTVDDNPNFAPTRVEQGGSQAVAVASALVRREVKENGWVANDPFFMPGYFNDNMQNFQMGMMAALGRFTVELNDFLARTRGSSESDPDTEDAKLLNQPGNIWVWDPSKSIWPRETSESLYIKAAEALDRYNTRLANNNAIYDRRADNLANTLDRIANDIGATSARLYRVATEEPGWFLFDWSSDDTFYDAKGRAYAYYQLLKAFETDFERVLAEKQLGEAYKLMLQNFEEVLRIDPIVVVNGSMGSQFTPNHLSDQGFLLLRARTQLREIVDILRA